LDIIQVENASVIFTRVAKETISLKTSILSRFTTGIFGKFDKKKEPFHALKNVSFNVEKGEVLGIIGNNGAGKSTLLRLVGGIYQPDTGRVDVKGTVSTLLSLGAGFENELSGIDNIYINGLYMGILETRLHEILKSVIEFSELSNFIDQPIKTFSSGMRARLGFSIAFFARCEIMLVDEILGVGDKNFKKKSTDAIKQLINSDRTVLLVSHNTNTIKDLCKRCIWLEKGGIKMFGDTDDIVNAYKK
jgi:ABC-type polysaccharide/polyol phosphate transport system ATPase subunit